MCFANAAPVNSGSGSSLRSGKKVLVAEADLIEAQLYAFVAQADRATVS